MSKLNVSKISMVLIVSVNIIACGSSADVRYVNVENTVDSGLQDQDGSTNKEDANKADSNTGNDAGSTCVPKTCEEVALELSSGKAESDACGEISDGCGKNLDCGGCSDLYQACGGTMPKIDGSPKPISTKNLCGGGCNIFTTWPSSTVPNTLEYHVHCTLDNPNLPPPQNVAYACTYQGLDQSSSIPYPLWICKAKL